MIAFDLARGAAAAGGVHCEAPFQVPADFQAYVRAVQPERIRVQATKLDSNDRRCSGMNLTDVDGAQPGELPWREIRRLEAKRPIDGTREQIFIVPLSSRVMHILIDDLTAITLSKLGEAGFRPAVVIQSSPTSFQAVLNVPMVCDDPETVRFVENHVTHLLNWAPVAHYRIAAEQCIAAGEPDKRIRQAQQRLQTVEHIGGGLGFGDPHLMGRRHPHRLPGCANQKSKYLRPDGSYPLVRVVSAEGGMCPASTALAQRAFELHAAMQKARREHDESVEKLGRTPAPKLPTQKKSVIYLEAGADLHAIWHAHRSDILRIQPAATEAAIDLMIAQRLRRTHHRFAEIAGAIRACSIAKYTNDSYARRIADKALNEESTAAIKRASWFHRAWFELERTALRTFPRGTG